MENKKRILLIQAYQGRKDPMGECFPIGLCCIATPLTENGHYVKIFDPNLSDAPYEDIKKNILAFNPDLVGLSVRNIDTCNKADIFFSFKTVQPTLSIIKETVPDVKIMVGGSGFSMFAEKIMMRLQDIDYGVYLEGDESVPELVENLDNPENVPGIYYRSNGRLIFTGPRPLPDIENLPIPRRDFLNVAQYPHPFGNLGIQTKRGCPLRCAYCSYPFLNGNRIRLRSPSKVVDEIQYLVNEFNVRQFMFIDGIFNKPEKHARAICTEMINRKLDVEWQAWFDMKSFSDDFLILAKKAGLKRIAFSPDAASNSSLLALKKRISVEDINRVISIAIVHKDMDFAFGFFATPPGQTFMGVLNTIYLYLKINILFSSRRNSGASISWIRIEPDTEVQQIAIREGFIDKDNDLLPENEEGLEPLYYSAPSMWLGDRLVELLNWSVNNLLKPVNRLLKQVRK